MSSRPSVTLKVNVAGAGAAAAQLDEVAKAQDKVADATADAAKAAAAQGDAGAKAQGKLSKLFEGLKAGAGAAAGAAAGLTGMAVTLKGQLSPEAQTAVGALQGLSGVLAAFGPVGQLASVVVSGVAAAVAAFDDTAIETAGNVDNFLTRAIKQLNDNMQTTETLANKAVDAVKRVGVAKLSDFAVLNAAEMAQTVKFTDELNRANQRAAEIGNQLTEVEQRRAAIEAKYGPGQTVDARQAANDELRAELVTQQKLIEARQSDISLTREAAEARLAGPRASAPSGGRSAAAAPKVDDSIERSVAFFVEQAKMAQANLVAAFTAATALAEQEAARVAEASAAAAAQYSAQIEQAIKAGSAAQQESMRDIQRDADQLIGIYDDLTSGVSDFGKAALEGFAAAAVSAAIYGGSLKDAANEALQAATVTAATEALIATAKGLGYLAAAAFGYAPGVAAAKLAFTSAATWAAIAGGAAAGAMATGGFGGGGGGGGGGGAGGPGSLGPGGGAPSALDRPAAPEAPQDREFFINLNSGAGGSKPLSRGDAGAIAGALVDIFRSGGMRLETRRA